MAKQRRHLPTDERRLRAQAGATLVDLLLVILIAGILTATGVPLVQGTLVDFRMQAAAEEVVAAVGYAQATSLASGCSTRVTFDPTANTVTVEKEVPVTALAEGSEAELAEELVEDTTFVTMENPWKRGSSYVLTPASSDWLARVEIADVRLGGEKVLVFDALGNPSCGGEVDLVSDQELLVLSLDPLSGRMSW